MQRLVAMCVFVVSAVLLLVYSPAARQSDVVLDDDGSYFGSFKAVVIDGGSGKAAMTWYSCEVDSSRRCARGSVRELRSERWSVKVADLIASGEEAAFVATVGGLLDGDEDVVAIGLTGGVRAALEGGLDMERVDSLLRRVSMLSGARFKGAVLTGLDEARYEYAAVDFLYGPGAISLSGGGVSCQIASRRNERSLALDLFAAQREAAVSEDQAWVNWQHLLDSEIDLLKTVHPALLVDINQADAVVALSMHASAASNAGIELERLVRADLALLKLDELSTDARDDISWKNRAADIPNPYNLDPTTLRLATLYASSRLAAIISQLLPPDKMIYFSRTFRAAPDSDDRLTADWSLGLFLEISGGTA